MNYVNFPFWQIGCVLAGQFARQQAAKAGNSNRGKSRDGHGKQCFDLIEPATDMGRAFLVTEFSRK